MAKITISDLHLSSDIQNINELNDLEMKTIEGGVVTRRRPPRNTSGSTTDTNDAINSTLSSIDDLLSNLRSEIGETMYNLRNQLGNL
ncbi:hypothetical protein IQ259_14505 [Fortiea sp. LEGE XX443]|uniref:hypothetical protein n=1 Tax=Fortiea sp. LEGE XX443 TaxID=1828611 RepID=UPI00187E9606|nr:hypothetical protein [Fortiea sp. LEGE XX443]MBE9006234.1 hypothetical protein [Fortiea sp. LEGE XX443]